MFVVVACVMLSMVVDDDDAHVDTYGKVVTVLIFIVVDMFMSR